MLLFLFRSEHEGGLMVQNVLVPTNKKNRDHFLQKRRMCEGRGKSSLSCQKEVFPSAPNTLLGSVFRYPFNPPQNHGSRREQ